MEMILGYKDAYSSFNIVNSSLVKTIHSSWEQHKFTSPRF